MNHKIGQVAEIGQTVIVLATGQTGKVVGKFRGAMMFYDVLVDGRELGLREDELEAYNPLPLIGTLHPLTLRGVGTFLCRIVGINVETSEYLVEDYHTGDLWLVAGA